MKTFLQPSAARTRFITTLVPSAKALGYSHSSASPTFTAKPGEGELTKTMTF